MRHVKFRKKSIAHPQIPTTALPDIIFILLFFFMVTTVPRKTAIKVVQQLPKAEQMRKLERKSLISYIYIGKPQQVEKFGTEPRIQVNDVFITPNEIERFVQQEKSKLSRVERDQLIIALKIDEEAKMGLITAVQNQLRAAGARRIMYTTVKKDVSLP